MNANSSSLTFQQISTSKINIGIALALISTAFIGLSFVVKKFSLLKLAKIGLRAADGGFMYLYDWLWWCGLLLMGLGEASNFVAYAFAPASLVTPLGGLSVLITAALSSYYFGERLDLVGQVGCFFCLLGSTVIILCGPSHEKAISLKELYQYFDSCFIAYHCVIAFLTIVMIFLVGPRYGKKTPLIYVYISASVGSITVIACKCLGIVFKDAFKIGLLVALKSWIFWFFLFEMIICLAIQIVFLNRSLDTFDSSIVTPLLYTFFTGFVLLVSGIIFREMTSLSAFDYFMNFIGLVIIISGVVFLTFFKLRYALQIESTC